MGVFMSSKGANSAHTDGYQVAQSVNQPQSHSVPD